MAKQKRMAEWTDCLGATSLPNDDFTFQTGNNFGLDGFQFSTPDNQGPEDGGRLPTTRGLSGLPDGTIPAPRERSPRYAALMDDSGDGLGMDLTDMLSSDEGNFDKEASIVEQEWLNPEQEQDPDRLPNQERTLNTIPTLEKAWGTHRPTTGLIPNRDKHARHFEHHASDLEVAEAIRHALRRAHYEKSTNDIQMELYARLGPDADRAVTAMNIIRDECGLLGKVFVRAAAFPGLKRGKWVKEIKRFAKTARYVITDDPGIAEKLGMKMVQEVPWNKALAFYTPKLKAAGCRVASAENARETLRQAFKETPDLLHEVSHKPVVRHFVATEEQVQQELSEPEAKQPKLPTPDENAEENKKKAALVKLAKWVKAGQLDREDALQIKNRGYTAADTLRAAAQIMTATKKVAVYEGQGTQIPEGAAVPRQLVDSSLASKTAAVEKAQMQKAQKDLVSAIKAGALTVVEAKRIAKQASNAQELTQIMGAAIQAAQAKRKYQFTAQKTAEYTGPVQQAVQHEAIASEHVDPYMQRVMQAAQAGEVKAGEITGLLKWARQQMTEGTMGTELDQFMKARFSVPLRKAAKPLFKEMRKAHEGLSGHLYVDAASYMSKTGTSGCERGGLKHRANSIKFVLASDRCGDCVFANAEGRCQQYNKTLVTAETLPVEDAHAYQAKVLQLANASDSEVTASMFNPGEFNLQNDTYEDVPLTESATAEELGEVLFGGMEV